MKLLYYIFLVTFIVSNSTQTMENNSQKKYTVGIKIPNNSYAGQPVNPVHMTITYLGCADEQKLKRTALLLAEINALRPIKVSVGASDTFGTQDRPVRIRRLKIEDNAVKEKLIQIHSELGECEPFQAQKLTIPNWHVSLKDLKLCEEFASKEDEILIAGKIFIKPLGNFDPILELE